jgi:hypothetical protein
VSQESIEERPQRRHPRVELLASVEASANGEVVIMTVRNISLGGVFVRHDGHGLSSFPVGSRHELTIFTPDDLEKELLVRGQVVRHEPDGMAFKWREDDTSAHRLSALVARSGKPRSV